MMVGHTKFSPDWCFGLLKQRFRVTPVNCLDDLVSVVTSSDDVNEAQFVGDQSGAPIVAMYDWAGFFGSLSKVPLITRQHHFRFTSDEPGVVKVKEYSDSTVVEHTLTSDANCLAKLATEFPETIAPKGLSLQRKWYLHDKIREFCPVETRDLVCPKPATPLHPTTPLPPPSPHRPPPPLFVSSVPVGVHLPPRKTQERVCSLCRQSGHNRRTCPTAQTQD